MIWRGMGYGLLLSLPFWALLAISIRYAVQ
jgi:hypothetical protein